MSTNILLLDINDTLDDGRTDEEIESGDFDDFFIGGEKYIPGVAIPKEGIEEFGEFLKEYHDRIIPIFWTAVGVRSQEKFVHEALNAPVYAFSIEFKEGVGELLVPGREKFYDNFPLLGGNPSSKDRGLGKVFSRFGEGINTIWLEDSLVGSIENYPNVSHVSMEGRYNPETQDYTRKPDRLVDKIEEIKNLLV